MSDLLQPALADLCFYDTETRALPGLECPEWGNITETSTRRYADSAKVIIFTYAIGDGPVQEWVLEDFDQRLDWADAPADLREFVFRGGERFFVAFNSAFDRHAVNHGMADETRCILPLDVEEVLDAAVLAAASNLPGNLEGFSLATGGEGKLPDAKRLIGIFCVDGGGTPQTHPADWEEFKDYARQDITALRDAYKVAMPLSRALWREFWAAERINDRGLPLDMKFVRAASVLAWDYAASLGKQVIEITGGDLHSIQQHVAIAPWIYDRVGEIEGAQTAMTKTYLEEEEGGELVPGKLGLDRHRVKRLLALLETVDGTQGLTDDEHAAQRLLTLREYGGSSTPKKFAKMLMHATPDGRLPSQYIFNGAQQTGRFSSRGVQMHNMTRSSLPNEEEVIAAITEGADLAQVKAMCGDVGKALAWTVRPAIAAPLGRTLVWGDWSNIEARVLPWLAGEDPGAKAVLEVFRAVDRDPVNNPDVYCLEASKIEGVPLTELWDAYRGKAPFAKAARQKGKIAVLSLGFGGGSGALLNMAANYGMAFGEDEATAIVNAWRAGNPWARKFWDDLWRAFLAAMGDPGTVYEAGRLKVIGTEHYAGASTVFVILPDGRPLTYPNVRWEKIKRTNGKGEVEERDSVVFQGQYGPKALWYGTIAENVTQASAASLLRATLTDLEYGDGPLAVCGHTHDEIIGETVDSGDCIETSKVVLHGAMVKDRGWTKDLPLAAEITANWYYTKLAD